MGERGPKDVAVDAVMEVGHGRFCVDLFSAACTRKRSASLFGILWRSTGWATVSSCGMLPSAGVYPVSVSHVHHGTSRYVDTYILYSQLEILALVSKARHGH